MFDQINVVGCGVIGLTTAITLQQRLGLPVQIVARDLPPHTTSNIAAAIWLPFQVSPADQAVRWAALTRVQLESQMREPDSGVFEVELFDLSPGDREDPYWIAAVDRFRYATAAELPAGYGQALVVRVPMIDTPVYMNWLLDQFQNSGGQVRQAALEDLQQAAAPDTLVVNCTGLGSRALCQDSLLFPIRGQIARLDVADYRRALTVEQGPDAVAYLLPRPNELIAGGTARHGDWSQQVDPGTANEILNKAKRLDPSLEGVRVIEHLVGLRPGRQGVRLESGQLPGGQPVVHNYGHGGAGFTLAWGCATDVADLASGLAAGTA